MKVLEQSKRVRKVLDEPRVTPDGFPYRATKWDIDGQTLEVNLDSYGAHARINGGRTHPNLDEHGLLAFLRRVFGL